MSQPAGLFSVSRPRRTLGPLQNSSGIPQPQSTLKRSSSSTDLRNPPYTSQHARSTSTNQFTGRPQQPVFQRSSSGSNLAELGQSAARRSTSINLLNSATASRQSLAPGYLAVQQTPASANLQRRSSIYSRPSNGMMAHQSVFTQPPAPAGDPKDPRPLKNRAYQAKIGQELLDYLTQNNFELDMKHSLTQKSVSDPTQKDFNYMFQWLYRRIDPAYKFQKNIDVEAPPILQQLRYPFAREIKKSQLTTVNVSNWSMLLGMLHWIMQLAHMVDGFSRGSYDEACAEAGVDVSGDRIMFRFLCGAYQDWLQVGPEDDDESAQAALTPHIQQMTAEFDRANARYVEELKIYEAENEALKAQVEEFERNAPDIAKLDKHFKILEDDKKKFEDYNANVQSKVEKYNSRIKILEAEIEKTNTDLQTVEQDRLQLQQAVDRQGLNVQDIDRMNTERERLQRSFDDALTALDEANRHVLEAESSTSCKLEDLESIVKRYNTLGYQMMVIPPTAKHANGATFELVLNLPSASAAFSSSTSQLSTSRSGPSDPIPSRFLLDASTGHSPHGLLPLDLRGTIRPALLSLRKDIAESRKTAQDSDLTARDFLDSISDALAEKHAEVDTLSHRVHQASESYKALKESTATAHTQSTAAIEKLEAELERMKRELGRGVLELEQREMEVLVAWEGMREEAGRVRERLHGGVERVIEEVVRFKMHVQEGLGEMEGWVVEEVERELDPQAQAQEGEDAQAF